MTRLTGRRRELASLVLLAVLMGCSAPEPRETVATGQVISGW